MICVIIEETFEKYSYLLHYFLGTNDTGFSIKTQTVNLLHFFRKIQKTRTILFNKSEGLP